MARVVCVLGAVLLAILPLGAADKKPWKDAQIQVGDIKIHYIEAGAGDRTLVCIPGLTMPAEVYREQLPYFAARGFRVIAFDPRSHGLTTKTEAGNTYHQQAADLHAFLQALKVENISVIGWSAGVVVILEYLSSPESVKPEKVVLVDGAPTGFKDGDYPGGFTSQQARAALLAYQEDRPKAADGFVRSMFKVRQPESLVNEIITASLKTPTGTALSLFFDLYTGDRRPALARIPAPTLVIATPENRLLGEYLQSKISRCRLEVIQEAGHAVFLDKPQTFNQVVEAFLGEE
jgi:microsomal epoxide hydrolase